MLKLGFAPCTIFYLTVDFGLANYILWPFIKGNLSNFAIFLLKILIRSILVFGTRGSLPYFCVFTVCCLLILAVDSFLPHEPLDTSNAVFANGKGLFDTAMKVPLTDLSFVYVLMFGTIM